MAGVSGALATIRAPRLRPARGAARSQWVEALIWQAAIALCAVAIGNAVAQPDRLRFALAGSGIILAAGLATRAGPALIYLLVAWTAVMGMVRRLLSGAAVAGQTDPILLVAITGILILTVVAAERGAFRRSSRLGSAVLLFNIVTAFEALNPGQGSLRSGITGLVFLLVPVLAFWIGRGLCDDRVITGILRVLGGVAIPVAIYGLLQTFVGFPSWDKRWITDSGYVALNIDDTIRAFGSFASAQEYALFLAVGIMTWFAYGFRGRRAPITIAATGLLIVALFYESSRTPIVTTIFAIGLVFAATRLRSPLVTVALGLAAVAIIPIALSYFGSSTPASTPAAPGAGALASHAFNGLAHPFSGQSSTLSGHIDVFSGGFRTMLHHPLGLGPAAVNIAGTKLHGVAGNTEYDPSNVAVALGVPGLLAYVVIVIEGFALALRRVRERRDVLARAALGIIAVTFLEWTNGGLYSVAFLPWLMLGWLDRDAGEAREAQAAREVEAAAPPGVPGDRVEGWSPLPAPSG